MPPGALTADGESGGHGMGAVLGEAVGSMALKGNRLILILSDLPAVRFGCFNFSSLNLIPYL